MLGYLKAHYPELLQALLEHIEICATALFLSSLLAFPLGYGLSKSGRKLTDGVLGFLGLLYAIPSMALLVLFVPMFGLGNVSATIVLSIYAQFALVRSILLGFQNIDPSLLEAGRGMGLSPLQMLLWVELPLALPAIIGGLRLSTSSIIGLASMGAFINAGGLGGLLFEGIYQNHAAKIFWGTLLIVGLALSAEWVLWDVERHALREAQGEAGA
ncbi:MAG TPA: ABC transporter permease [Oculatellaceae cyanobacterium]|jgi:osmoprotectant transport system permease protein